MTPARPMADEIVFSAMNCLVVLLAFVGLIARGRWRLSLAFCVYLPCALATGAIVLAWPDRFYNGATWMITQGILAILKLALVLEVAWRTFRVFPGARAAARMALLAVMAPTALAVATVPMTMNGWSSFQTALGHLHPIVLGGTIWMICVVLAAAHVYRVPVHPFHVAVLTSFALYNFCFASIIRLLVLFGFDHLRPYANVLDGAAYQLLACWWAYVAWRPDTEGARAYAETVTRLQERTPPVGASLSNPTLFAGDHP